mgnify:CR=1 FL=1
MVLSSGDPLSTLHFTQEPTLEDLAPRQREVLEYIASYMDNQGMSPSLREVGDALGIKSTNGVADHIKALVRKGYVERSGSGKARALRMTVKATGNVQSSNSITIPIIGKVAAGLPILATENYEGSLHVDASWVPSGSPIFALCVSGESMIEDGIFDGDYLFVKQQSHASNGETVVAMVEDEATVKRFYKENNTIRLQPANSSMEPIMVTPDMPISILGTVVGLYRQL